jgi:hypothetical protein
MLCSILRALVTAALALTGGAALAGPPYDTDDPEPTELGHWEIYAFAAGDRADGILSGQAGVDLNYGPAPGVQLTATIPFDYETGAGTRVSRGDLELGVKYRFLHREKAGVSLAVFPRLILPTAGRHFGTGRVQVLLPLWGQKDMGDWSLFGGGGYTVNPGRGNRDFWLAGAALTHNVSKRLSLGVEATRQGPDAVGAGAVTTLGAGGIYALRGAFSLLISAGPEFERGRDRAGWHGYIALGLSF